MSSWAITDCENTVGDSAVSTTLAVATGALATCRPSSHSPVNPKAATTSMAVRVTSGE